MLTVNPFSILAETIPSIFIQSFVVVMAILVILGTLLDIIHKKNVKYFFKMQKKQNCLQLKLYAQVKKYL